jgi:hypothetical protein
MTKICWRKSVQPRGGGGLFDDHRRNPFLDAPRLENKAAALTLRRAYLHRRASVAGR